MMEKGRLFMAVMVTGFLSAVISPPVHAERRCREVQDICFPRCDPDGTNCYNDCPKKMVCEEVKGPSSPIQLDGGKRNDKFWGGIALPLDPKLLKPYVEEPE